MVMEPQLLYLHWPAHDRVDGSNKVTYNDADRQCDKAALDKQPLEHLAWRWDALIVAIVESGSYFVFSTFICRQSWWWAWHATGCIRSTMFTYDASCLCCRLLFKDGGGSFNICKLVKACWSTSHVGLRVYVLLVLLNALDNNMCLSWSHSPKRWSSSSSSSRIWQIPITSHYKQVKSLVLVLWWQWHC